MTYNGYWRNPREENRRAMLMDYGVINKVWYLFPQGGGPRGSFETFTALAPNLRSRDLVYLSGVLREQAVCPVGVFDVTVLGAANRPRQATNSGVPTGGGASWLAPTSPVATTPLIQVIEQGWRFENIQFAPVAASSCIRFRRRESATIPDASHGQVVGCYFSTGGAAGLGVEISECKRILVEDCDFEALGTGYAIRTTADGGVANPNYCVIRNNRFQRGNTNDLLATNAQDFLIEGNVFYGLAGIEGGIRLSCVGGARNRVIFNYFSDATAQYSIAGGYVPGASTDRWRNFVSDAADPVVANPA